MSNQNTTGTSLEITITNTIVVNDLLQIQDINEKPAFVRLTIKEPTCGDIWFARVDKEEDDRIIVYLDILKSTVQERLEAVFKTLLDTSNKEMTAHKMLNTVASLFGRESIDYAYLMSLMVQGELWLPGRCDIRIEDDERLRLMRQAVKLLTKLLGKDCPFLIQPLAYLAKQEMRKQKHRQAQRKLKQAVRIARRVFAKEYNKDPLVRILGLLATNYQVQMEYELAEPIYEEILTIEKREPAYFQYKLAQCIWAARNDPRATSLFAAVAQLHIEEQCSWMDVCLS